jgi:hypothetical protein
LLGFQENKIRSLSYSVRYRQRELVAAINQIMMWLIAAITSLWMKMCACILAVRAPPSKTSA